MSIPKLVAKFETILSAGIDYSATSMTLVSITTKNVANLPAGVYGFAIDEGTSDEEYVLGTCDGSTSVITSLVRGLSYHDGSTAVPALAKAHRKGAQVKITDHPALTEMYARSLVWKGDYNALTAYSEKDAVSYQGSSFVAKGATTGNLPTDTTYWSVLASAGADDGAGSVEPGTSGNVMTSNGVTWESQPIPSSVLSGDYAARTLGTEYQAAENGFFVVNNNNVSGTFQIFIDNVSPPTREIAIAASTPIITALPVKKNQYYKVTGGGLAHLWWVPWQN